MEIGMLNFWLELLVTAQTKENYFNIYTVLVGVLQKQSSVPGGGGLQNPELPIYLELQSSVLPLFLEKNMMMMDRRGVIE